MLDWGEIRTPTTRQLCHWSGAFQTWTATSSFDGVTRNNRYDSANAGLWGAVRKNIISDRFSTKTAISAHI